MEGAKLCALHRRQGHVRFLAWNGSHDQDSQNNGIRRKVGPMGDKIDTVWGVGYRFIS
jgi:hypothetical protein